MVYGEDEALAFRRARAVRGELAERHSMDPARIIATGRKAQGHTGDLSVVDVYAADATRCGGCAGSTFRTIALDSAAMPVVTSTAEALPADRRRRLQGPAQPAARRPPLNRFNRPGRPLRRRPQRPAPRLQPAEARHASSRRRRRLRRPPRPGDVRVRGSSSTTTIRRADGGVRPAR